MSSACDNSSGMCPEGRERTGARLFERRSPQCQRATAFTRKGKPARRCPRASPNLSRLSPEGGAPGRRRQRCRSADPVLSWPGGPHTSHDGHFSTSWWRIAAPVVTHATTKPCAGASAFPAYAAPDRDWLRRLALSRSQSARAKRPTLRIAVHSRTPKVASTTNAKALEGPLNSSLHGET